MQNFESVLVILQPNFLKTIQIVGNLFKLIIYLYNQSYTTPFDYSIELKSISNKV